MQYADGTTDDVVVKVHEAVHEQRIPLKGAVRRISARDDIVPVDILR